MKMCSEVLKLDSTRPKSNLRIQRVPFLVQRALEGDLIPEKNGNKGLLRVPDYIMFQKGTGLA